MSYPLTSFLLPNEPAWGLLERNQLVPVGKGTELHRIQKVFVVRNDAIACHVKDLGPAANYKAPEFWHELAGVHSVAEALELADCDRIHDDYWEKRQKEMSAESTLIQDAINWRETAHRVIHNRSSFGPGIAVQRNGFPLQEVLSNDERTRRRA